MQDFLNYSDYIQQISLPLFDYMPVRHFSYIEADTHGNFYALSSDKHMYEEFIQSPFYQRTPFHALLSYGKPGLYLNDFYSFPQLPPLRDHKEFLADYGYGHTCMIMRHEIVQGQNVCKIYSFDGDVKNVDVNHDYLNNLDILRKFTTYIDQKIVTVRDALQKNSYPVQYEMALFQDSEKENSHDWMNTKSQLLSLLNGANSPEPKPTSREMEIIMWNLKGKTAEETAAIMGISRRTVEKHFEKLRKKFGCYSKSQVALRMAKYLDF